MSGYALQADRVSAGELLILRGAIAQMEAASDLADFLFQIVSKLESGRDVFLSSASAGGKR